MFFEIAMMSRMLGLDICGAPDLQPGCTTASRDRLFAIMSTGYEAELHSQARRARRRIGVPERCPAPQFSWSSRGTRRDTIGKDFLLIPTKHFLNSGRSVFVSLADIVPINFLDVTISVGNGVSGDSRRIFRGPTPATRSVVASLRPGGPSAHEYQRALKDGVALAATVTHQSGNSPVAMIPVRHALAVRRPRRNATQSPRIASVTTP